MEADYVIVGAGSAGCATAFRLVEAGHSVIVVEFGGTDAGPFINMPGALSYPMNMKRYDWGFQTEPEPHLGGRRLACPRGKVIGGSSSINGMIYVRGHARDFDHWRDAGAEGWGYADVLPYFQRMENWDDGGHGGDPSWRGTKGPLYVSRGKRDNPLTQAFVEAGRQAGYPVTPDYNGAQQEGFGPFDMTVHEGQRWSAAKAYLRPAQATGRCIIAQGLAHKVIIEDGRATGVDMGAYTIKARAEVVLAASAINSPKLLMLSGIGPAAHLAQHGITPIADRPGVGKNLQDHLELYIQYHFLPLAVRYDGKAVAEGHGFQAHVGPMRSPSRGEVTLKSKDPAEAPRIFFNYMSHDEDWRDFRKAIRLTREIFEQDAFAPYLDHELQPGAAATEDRDLDRFIRDHAESAYHPCGTCKMGASSDPMAVVDPECRVIGVDRLRVADSSIFPRITNGNLNGPSIMTGEKAADQILGRRLPPANMEPWIHPHWQTSQR
ncbi:MAG: GMC family oxidoreductase N-terminal domain-containing protein [Pseudomonadota bacterium]